METACNLLLLKLSLSVRQLFMIVSLFWDSLCLNLVATQFLEYFAWNMTFRNFNTFWLQKCVNGILPIDLLYSCSVILHTESFKFMLLLNFCYQLFFHFILEILFVVCTTGSSRKSTIKRKFFFYFIFSFLFFFFLWYVYKYIFIFSLFFFFQFGRLNLGIQWRLTLWNLTSISPCVRDRVGFL